MPEYVNPNPPGVSSGSSTPGLPVWTYSGVGTTPAAGHFQTDNSDPNVPVNIYFNVTPKIGGMDSADLFTYSTANLLIVLTSSSGKAYVFQATALGTESGGVVTILGQWNPVNDGVALSGDYSVSFAPAPQNPPHLSDVLSASSITPIADGTVDGITTAEGTVTANTPPTSGDGTFSISGSLGGSITILNGRVTAFTPAT